MEEQGAAVRDILEDFCRRSGIPAYGICRLENFCYLPSRKQKLLPDCGSVLLFVLPYYAGAFPERNISLYAVGEDYHTIAQSLLSDAVAHLKAAFPHNLFLTFSDSGPIPEVEAAIRAGLGFRGRNRQFITERYGSLCFLAEIVTDLVLPPDVPLSRTTCENCGACLAACPTGALSEAGFAVERCRSHITQKKRELSPWEEEQIAAGSLAWGCDLCTLACPHNHGVPRSPIEAFLRQLDPILTEENLTALAARKSYGWRGEAVLRRNLALIEKKG